MFNLTRAVQTGGAVAVLAMALAPATAMAGPPFRTDDPEPVEYQHWEIYGFSTGTHSRDNTNLTLPGVEVNYGAAPDLMVHLVAPLVYDKTTGTSAQYGSGDTELGFKYRFVEEDEKGWRPMVGIFPLVELPSGDQNRGLGTGHTHAFIPLWIQKSFGPWTTYGGGGYWINPGPGNQNYWYVGWQVQRQITDQFAFGAEIFHQTAVTQGGDDSTGFNFGGIYDFNRHYHLLFSAGRGLQNASTTNEFSYYLALQWTF